MSLAQESPLGNNFSRRAPSLLLRAMNDIRGAFFCIYKQTAKRSVFDILIAIAPIITPYFPCKKSKYCYGKKQDHENKNDIKKLFLHNDYMPISRQYFLHFFKEDIAMSFSVNDCNIEKFFSVIYLVTVNIK